MNFTEEQLVQLNVSELKNRDNISKFPLEDYSDSRLSLSKNIIQFRNGFVNLKDSGHDNLQIAMSVVSEFMNYGYIINQDGIGNISRASKEDIVIFHNEILDYIKTMTGSNMEYRPFWPNFPESVMNKSEVELWLHQIAHYMSNGEYTPNELTTRARTASTKQMQQHQKSNWSLWSYRGWSSRKIGLNSTAITTTLKLHKSKKTTSEIG